MIQLHINIDDHDLYQYERQERNQPQVKPE